MKLFGTDKIFLHVNIDSSDRVQDEPERDERVELIGDNPISK